MSPTVIFIISLAVMIFGIWWFTADHYDENFGGLGALIAFFAFVNLIITACGGYTPTPPPKPGSVEAHRAAEEKVAAAKKAALDKRLKAGEVIAVNTAPDGTKLWMTLNPDGEKVYFTADRVQRQSD